MKNDSKFSVEKKNILDVLLDEDNNDIILMRGNGGLYTFEQIAIIPKNQKLYCILKPVTPIDGIAEDEGVVFYVHEEDGKVPCLLPERDDFIASEVFDEYYRMLDELDN